MHSYDCHVPVLPYGCETSSFTQERKAWDRPEIKQNVCLITNERSLSDDLGVDGGVILKQVFKDWRERGCELDTLVAAQGPAGGPSLHGN